MTVREAFEKAFGPLPEGATCHPAIYVRFMCTYLSPTYKLGDATYVTRDRWLDTPPKWVPAEPEEGTAEGPDISDRPASAFLGFFGEEYDRVVRQR